MFAMLIPALLVFLAPLVAAAPVPRCPNHARSSATETPVAPSSSGLKSLFPVPNTLKSWSTSKDSTHPLPLSDNTFRPIKSQLTPTFVTAPDGEKSLRAYYPQGSYALSHKDHIGGLSFYAQGPSNVDLTTAKEATFGYSVLFEKGFEFNLGGKLPGLYGGNTPSGSLSCSGGSRDDSCFSARFMFREEGKGELYTYLPPSFSQNQVQCHVKPFSVCNPTYGASVGRGAFSFKPGQRTTVSQRVRLNDVGKANGQIQVFVNGESVINVSGLVLRNSGEGRIRGLDVQSFFGGHTSEYASPKSQSAYFSDFSVAITETL